MVFTQANLPSDHPSGPRQMETQHSPAAAGATGKWGQSDRLMLDAFRSLIPSLLFINENRIGLTWGWYKRDCS